MKILENLHFGPSSFNNWQFWSLGFLILENYILGPCIIGVGNIGPCDKLWRIWISALNFGEITKLVLVLVIYQTDPLFYLSPNKHNNTLGPIPYNSPTPSTLFNTKSTGSNPSQTNTQDDCSSFPFPPDYPLPAPPLLHDISTNPLPQLILLTCQDQPTPPH